MDFRPDWGPWGGIVPVPRVVLDKHIKLCSGMHLKVLLLVLANQAGQPDKIAAQLGMDPADVLDALNYWMDAGILCPGGPDTSTRPAVPAAYHPQQTPAIDTQTVAETGQKITTMRQRGKLTKEEINQMSAVDPLIPCLLQEAQAYFGKTFSSAESETLVYLYHYCHLTPDYILMAIEYCKSIGKCNMRYIEKTVLGWVESGIDDFGKAETHIETLLQSDKNEKSIRNAFQIYDRALSSKEKQFIHTWMEDWQFSLPMTQLAYERSVDNTGKVSFPYINKILESWHHQSIDTPQKAAQESKPKLKPTRETSYDVGELEWLLEHGTLSDQG